MREGQERKAHSSAQMTILLKRLRLLLPTLEIATCINDALRGLGVDDPTRRPKSRYMKGQWEQELVWGRHCSVQHAAGHAQETIKRKLY